MFSEIQDITPKKDITKRNSRMKKYTLVLIPKKSKIIEDASELMRRSKLLIIKAKGNEMHLLLVIIKPC